MTSIPTQNYLYNSDIVKYKYLERVDKTPDYPSISEISAAQKYLLHRNHSRYEETKQEKIKAEIPQRISAF